MADRDAIPEEVKTPFQQIKWAASTKDQREQILYNLGFRNKEKRQKYLVDWGKLTIPVQTILMNSL